MQIALRNLSYSLILLHGRHNNSHYSSDSTGNGLFA
jgi:hypothetical protein